MRIAVLYSGYLRTWDACKNNQKDNFYTPDTDSFFYTDQEPDSCKQFIKMPGVYYDPIYEHPYMINKNPYSSIDSTLNQWHNQFIGFCIVPNDYDIYVKSRCDIQLSGKIDLRQYEINDTNIYIPHGNDHWGGVNDQFAFGSYTVMKKYYSVYLQHQNIFNGGQQFHPEGYVTKNLEDHGITINRLTVTNNIIR